MNGRESGRSSILMWKHYASKSTKGGRIVVDVRQVIRDLTGNIKADQIVQHVYQMRGELITSMEIRRR